MKKILLITAIFTCAISTMFAQTNLNLETWGPNGFGGEDPTGWGTLNGFMALGAPQTTFKNTTTPGEGTASAKLTSINFPGAVSFGAPADTVGGMLFLGYFNMFTNASGIAYTQKPVSVDFLYKANPLGNDMGVLIVQLQHRDTILDSTIVDGQGLMTFTNQVATWTTGSVCINYFDTLTPDTFKIMAASSAIMFGLLPRGVGEPGSELELDSFVINLPGALSAAITGLVNVNCKGECTGAVNITPSGTPPYTYAWTNGDNTATAGSLCAGIVYSVFVTDSIGDKTCLSALVSEPATAITATTSSTDETAPGANDGTADVLANGGTPSYTYLWDDPLAQTTASIGGLAGGTYTVTVTDTNGCIFVASAIVNTVGCAVLTSITKTDETVDGANDGTASVSASGGTGTYTYSWNTTPSQTTNSIGGLTPGTYTVTVTDSFGCSKMDSVTINAGPSGIQSFNDLTNRVSVYPVPAVNELNIATAFNGDVAFDIFNIIGEKIKSVAIISDITKVSTIELHQGIYFYQIIDAHGSVLSKGKFNIVR